MYDETVKNRHGYHELKSKPDRDELRQYYEAKYYQDPKGSYQKKYSEAERRYIDARMDLKYSVLSRELPEECARGGGSFLDVGSGEGWAMRYFLRKSWAVRGLDFSSYGCRMQNPDLLQHVAAGDLMENMVSLAARGIRFDVVMLDNVLEHVLEPSAVLETCRHLVNEKGILVVEVPNDFSVLQDYLYTQGFVSKPFWVVRPDHISYFNKDGLISLCADAGFCCTCVIGDYPIDIHLLNSNTNYVEDPAKGKSCHETRVIAENLLAGISVEKTVQLYRVLADMGLGRSIIGFFRLARR